MVYLKEVIGMKKLYKVEAHNFMSGPLSKEDAEFIVTYAISNINFLPIMGEWHNSYEPSKNWKLKLANNLRNRIEYEKQWHTLPSEVVSKIRELYQKLWDKAMDEI